MRTLEALRNGELSAFLSGFFMLLLHSFEAGEISRPVGMEGEEYIQRGHDTNKARVGVVFSE